MIRPLAGWMLVQPLLNQSSANEQLRVGRVHAIGEIPDETLAQRIPFKPGDRVCWIDGVGQVHVLNETLLLVSLNAPLAYEPADAALAAEIEDSCDADD